MSVLENRKIWASIFIGLGVLLALNVFYGRLAQYHKSHVLNITLARAAHVRARLDESFFSRGLYQPEILQGMDVIQKDIQRFKKHQVEKNPPLVFWISLFGLILAGFYIFIGVKLSRRGDCHRNVLRWCSAVWAVYAGCLLADVLIDVNFYDMTLAQLWEVSTCFEARVPVLSYGELSRNFTGYLLSRVAVFALVALAAFPALVLPFSLEAGGQNNIEKL